jgi:DNA-binding NarL/FixJ family response regulator
MGKAMALITMESDAISSEPASLPSSRGARSNPWRVRSGRTTLLLVDAMTLNRECLGHALRVGARDFEVVVAASTRDIDAAAKPDVALFNINAVPAEDEWVRENLSELRRRIGDAPVVLISANVDERAALRAVSGGARGIIPASVDIGMLLAAVRLVLAGGTFIPQELVQSYVRQVAERGTGDDDDVTFLGFTPREAEVVRKIREGKLNKVIAYELNITESTVKIHVRHIMRKLNATNRTQVAYLVQNRADAK